MIVCHCSTLEEESSSSSVWEEAAPLLGGGILLQSVHVRLPSSEAPTTTSVNIHLTQNVQSTEESPFVYILLVSCVDLQAYRKDLKARVDEWYKHHITQHTEWFILYFQNSGYKGDQVYAEARQYFKSQNFDDRVCMLEFEGNRWKTMLKAVIEREISRRYREYETELSSFCGQYNTSAQMYSRFFAVRDNLAFLYEALRLPKEVLRQYNEVLNVEAKLQTESNNLPSTSLFTQSSHSVREAVEKGQISLQELKIYIYSRKAKCLFALNKPSEVLRSGLQLVQSIIEQYKSDYHAISWGCKACWDLVCMFRREYSDSINNETQFEETEARVGIEEVRVTSTLVCDMLRFLSMHLLSIAAQENCLASSHVWQSRSQENKNHMLLWMKNAQPDIQSLPAFERSSRPQECNITTNAHLEEDINWFYTSLSTPEKFESSYTYLLQLLIYYYQLTGRGRFSHLVLNELVEIAWSRGDYRRALDALDIIAGPEIEWDEWMILQRQLIYKALCYRQLGDLKAYFQIFSRLSDSRCQSSTRDKALEQTLENMFKDINHILQRPEVTTSLHLQASIIDSCFNCEICKV